jgi:hypothetical protein
MSPNGPLGATPQTGAFELRSPARARASVARTRLGMVGLAGVVLCGLLLCLSAAQTDSLLPESVRPVPAWLAGPFGTSGLRLGVVALLITLMAMFAFYAIVMRSADRLSPRLVLMAIAALHALVLLAPPLLSTDVFSYQAYARMWDVYSSNPYLNGPHAIALDPLYPFIGAKWVNTPTAYGPIFTLLSTTFGEVSIAVSALAYKAIAAVASLGTIAVLWNAARLRGLNPVRAVALFGLNPLIVVYGVGGGHNDLLMLLASTAGIYALLAHRERASGALIVIGAGIKLTAGLLLPFALASGVELGAPKRRRAILTGAVAAALGVAAIGIGFFGTGPFHLLGTLNSIQSQGDWHAIPVFITGRLGIGILGWMVGPVLGVVFIGIFAWLVRRVWYGEMDWIDGAGWATVAILLTTSSLCPWYIGWLMPLVALCTSRRLWRVAIALTGVIQFITMLGYIPHGRSFLGL